MNQQKDSTPNKTILQHRTPSTANSDIAHNKLNYSRKISANPLSFSKYSNSRFTKQEQLIKGLLAALGYSKAEQAFNRQHLKKLDSSSYEQNGEERMTKSDLVRKQSSSFPDTVEEIICQSKGFEEMIYYLSEALQYERMNDENQEQVSEQNVWLNHIKQYESIEKSVQELFTSKQKIVLPCFRSFEADLDNKEILLADIDSQNNVCLIDGDHCLHMINNKESKAKTAKLESKHHGIDLKWATKDLIFLLTSNNKMLFYKASSLQITQTIRTHRDHLVAHDITIINKEPKKSFMYILGCSQTKFWVLTLRFDDMSVIVENKFVMSGIDHLKSISLLFVPFESDIQFDKQSNQISLQKGCLHYYGLMQNQKSIIKIDSLVQKSGVFWTAFSRYKIEELTSSENKSFLTILLSPSGLTERNQKKQKMLEEQESLEYQIIKLNSQGCIIERFRPCLQCRDFPLGFLGFQIKNNYIGRLVSLSKKLNPNWLRSFSWHNEIYYISLKSGRIIHKYHSEGEDIKLHAIGDYNSLLYSNKKQLILMTTKETKTRRVSIDWTKSYDLRETLMQRFSRLPGIPQNLLLLLRSLRNNDLQIEFPDS